MSGSKHWIRLKLAREYDLLHVENRILDDRIDLVSNAPRYTPALGAESNGITVDLILWRHADAAEGGRDLERKLTAKGRKQAARVGEWLGARLPARYKVLTSPARRARETADALGVRYAIVERLAPGAAPGDILRACGWPSHKGAVVVVGHQPDLGRLVALLVGGTEAGWSVKKGGLWWLSNRERGGGEEVVVRAMLTPDLV